MLLIFEECHKNRFFLFVNIYLKDMTQGNILEICKIYSKELFKLVEIFKTYKKFKALIQCL